MSHVREITTAEFEEFVKTPQAKDEIAVVQFSASWCGPCKILTNAMSQEVDALEASGKVRVAKVDVEAEADLSTRFGIRALPTVIFFRDGQPVHELRKGVNFGTVKDALRLQTTDEEDDF